MIARKKLTETEKEFARTLFGVGFDGVGLSTTKSIGDKALFGGYDTERMKAKLGINKKKPLADYLPTITIKAKDLAMEMTTFKTKEKQSKDKKMIINSHVEHNSGVRKVLTDQGIYPENLPVEEDIKKLERKKIKTEEKNNKKKLV